MLKAIMKIARTNPELNAAQKRAVCRVQAQGHYLTPNPRNPKLFELRTHKASATKVPCIIGEHGQISTHTAHLEAGNMAQAYLIEKHTIAVWGAEKCA